MSHFEFGPTIDLLNLPDDEAKAILGAPVYECLKKTWQPTKGHLRVMKVDRQKGEITVQWEHSVD